MLRKRKEGLISVQTVIDFRMYIKRGEDMVSSGSQVSVISPGKGNELRWERGRDKCDNKVKPGKKNRSKFGGEEEIKPEPGSLRSQDCPVASLPGAGHLTGHLKSPDGLFQYYIDYYFSTWGQAC